MRVLSARSDLMGVFIETASKLKGMGFWHVMSSTAFVKIASFAYSIVIVRIVSVSDYGVYSYAANFFNFFVLFSGFGLAPAILQLCSEGCRSESSRAELFSYSSTIALVFNTVLCGAMVLFSASYEFKVEGTAFLFVLMAPLIFPNLYLNLLQSKMRADLNNAGYSAINVITAIFMYLFAAVGALLYGIIGLVIGQYVSYAIPIAVASLRYNTKVKLALPKIGREEKRVVFSVAGISMLNSGMSQLMLIVTIFLLGFFIQSEVAVAQYRVATMIPVALGFIPGAVMTWAYPYLARRMGDDAWLRPIYARISLYMVCINLAIAASCILLAPFIVSTLFGNAYLNAVPCFQIMMAYYFVAGSFSTVSGQILLTQRKLLTNLAAGVVSVAVSALLCIWLIPGYGIQGAAAAQLVAAAATSVFSAVMLLLHFRKGGLDERRQDHPIDN